MKKFLPTRSPPDHFLSTVFSCPLSGFRQGYSCQDTLLTLMENKRRDLLKNNKIGALLMNLSKAFDCMPHDLLIAKFKDYGVLELFAGGIENYQRPENFQRWPASSFFSLIESTIEVGPLTKSYM